MPFQNLELLYEFSSWNIQVTFLVENFTASPSLPQSLDQGDLPHGSRERGHLLPERPAKQGNPAVASSAPSHPPPISQSLNSGDLRPNNHEHGRLPCPPCAAAASAPPSPPPPSQSLNSGELRPNNREHGHAPLGVGDPSPPCPLPSPQSLSSGDHPLDSSDQCPPRPACPARQGRLESPLPPSQQPSTYRVSELNIWLQVYISRGGLR